MACEGIESAEFDSDIPTPQVDFRSMIIEQSSKLEEENALLQRRIADGETEGQTVELRERIRMIDDTKYLL